jgi:hypothetical protein
LRKCILFDNFHGYLKDVLEFGNFRLQSAQFKFIMVVLSFSDESANEFWEGFDYMRLSETPRMQYTENMEAIQTLEQPTFETVWAILQEVAKNQKETDRIVKENAERQKELTESQKKTDQIVGRLGLRMGEVVEYLVAPNLRDKFTEFGLDFPKANQGTRVNDKVNNISFEIDIMLENGDKAMLVEAKTKPSTVDVKEHIKRLQKMRKYADLHGDKRAFLGAVAGVVMTDNVKNYAINQGFFVMEPSGETFKIIPPTGKPKEF